jgi:competence ComEA-like helix-hairpin-helix protein
MTERPKISAFLLIILAFFCVYFFRTRLFLEGSPKLYDTTQAEVNQEQGLDKLSQGARLVLGALVDINVATAAELRLLPGIGEKLSKRIVAERQEGGRYSSTEALRRVKGLSPSRLRRITPYITIKGV